MENKKNKLIKAIKKQKILNAILISCILLSLYYLSNINLNQTKINETTKRYISFYKNNTTDRLIINNIKRTSSKIGKSKWNKASLTFQVTGEKNKEYEVLLIPKDNRIDEKYINYILLDNKKEYSSNIKSLEKKDEGSLLYQGKINNNKLTIRLWISKKYKGIISKESFEIIIKPR